MKIRTITAGCNIKQNEDNVNEKLINQTAEDLSILKHFFEKNGYTVQTVRLSTQPWESYASTKSELFDICSMLQSFSPKKIDYFNIGPISTSDHLSWLPTVLERFPSGFCTVDLCRNNRIHEILAWKTAQLMKKNSLIEKKGFANLRFAALCNVKANTPFYPASYHNGPPSFGLGCENSDIIYNVFSSVDSYDDAFEKLHEKLTIEYQQVEQIAKEASQKTNLSFHGIDGSISPSVHPDESLIYGIEKLPFITRFGEPGSLTAARLITSVLKQLPITRCGYNGLMLPVMEDSGLAQRNKEQCVSLTKLLFYSSVCGTGLDTIPLPGICDVETLYGILLDVASLSTTLQKPLSARLMPIPLKKAFDSTEFDFDYFENTTVMNP